MRILMRTFISLLLLTLGLTINAVSTVPTFGNSKNKIGRFKIPDSVGRVDSITIAYVVKETDDTLLMKLNMMDMTATVWSATDSDLPALKVDSNAVEAIIRCADIVYVRDRKKLRYQLAAYPPFYRVYFHGGDVYDVDIVLRDPLAIKSKDEHPENTEYALSSILRNVFSLYKALYYR